MSRNTLFIIVAAASLVLSGVPQESAAQGMMGRGMMGGGMMGRGMMGGGMMGGYGKAPERYQGGEGSDDLKTPGGRAFASTCAQCHVLPDPAQHAAQQWPSVVARMEAHMRDAHVTVPNRKTTHEIESFLERHARN